MPLYHILLVLSTLTGQNIPKMYELAEYTWNMSANSDTFSQWLNTELTDRGWSFRELSRRSGISTTHISEMANDRRAVGFDSCVSIARAFGLPPEQVLRRAGKLPPQPPAVTEEKEAGAILRIIP